MPDNARVEACKANTDLEVEARAQGKDLPCIWYRGLLPAAMLNLPAAPEDEHLETSGLLNGNVL